MQKFLIIQTAFIGDVVLATSLIEKLHQYFPKAEIDFLVRKGNESLLANNPHLHDILIWDKKKYKQRNLWKLLKLIRKTHYDKVINVQRFAATGLLTAFSSAKEKIGFDKNPMSFFFSKKIPHSVNNNIHEVERNMELIKEFTDDRVTMPKLYPSEADFKSVAGYKQNPYISISPASVWFTKQYPHYKWVSFINKIPDTITVYLCGGTDDNELCKKIADACKEKKVISLCGKLSFLQSAALMKDALMNYTNDSAPMHFASAMNAPVAAVFCSTVPSFGFGPLSDKKSIIECEEQLDCRPCGLHGHASCPKSHFNCANKISDKQLLEALG